MLKLNTAVGGVQVQPSAVVRLAFTLEVKDTQKCFALMLSPCID